MINLIDTSYEPLSSIFFNCLLVLSCLRFLCTFCAATHVTSQIFSMDKSHQVPFILHLRTQHALNFL
jgi:hypothetical protein